ncbi:MAG TPA: isoprenylcysteine carboxylmethyltransferase family protein [Candidatus Xenobia bacterium]
MSQRVFSALLAATVAERAVELAVSRRHVRALLRRGGREFGQGHYPAMVAVHAALLVGSLAETWLKRRRRNEVRSAVCLGLVVAAQALRWSCIAALGPCWSTRVVVVPGTALVRSGPYAWLRHPNYLAVAVEGLALPMTYGAWWTAVGFTAANAALMAVRIPCEEAALRWATT